MVTQRVSSCLSKGLSLVAVLLSLMLCVTTLWANRPPTNWLGTVVFANHAHLGIGQVAVGTTVFSGDRISTEQSGSVQVRMGAARFVLDGSSIATLTQEEASPAVTLALGSATFSTANAKAFTVHIASALIRPKTDQSTIGKVIVVNPREFVVKSVRGSLSISVEDDIREIPEGAAYHILLDTNAPVPQGPRGAGTKGTGGPPIRAGKSNFIWYAVAITAGVTAFAVQEALESPDRP
jgi:hypothetical protein